MAQRNSMVARLFGLVFIAAGIAGWWYNRHLAATQGEFYIKLCVFGPLAVSGGFLMLIRPEWAGPLRPGSTRAHKIALFSVLGFMTIGSGLEMYHMLRPGKRPPVYTPWTPAMGTPPRLVQRASLAPPEMTFLGRNYRLASYNQTSHPMWEFVPAGENIDGWKNLLTVIDRPDARTRQDLDKLAEGILSNYKSHNARILLAKTLQESSGAAYNYIVAAFEEPSQHRYELNFVKIAASPVNAAIMIYGVRIGDPDYTAQAKNFLDRNSSSIGRALNETAFPDIAALPRRVF